MTTITERTLWTNIGQEVKGDSIGGILENAGLNWEVHKRPIFVDGVEYKDSFATVRQDNKSVLGVVGTRYNIIQNQEAFGFIDNLLDNKLGLEFKKAGALQGGKRVWLIASMPDKKILGDNITPYLIFSNAHDGSGMVKIAVVPLRIICQNQLNYAFKHANRAWNVRHIKSFESKLKEASQTLQLTNKYMEEFDKQAELLAKKKITAKQVKEMTEELFLIPEKASDKKIQSISEERDTLIKMYNTNDLQNFKGTAWGFLNAVSDMNTHQQPKKETDNWHENKFARMLEGYQMELMDRAMTLVNAL